jgi:hypothetical protein
MVHPVRRGAAGAEGVLQAAVKAFQHPVRLRMVGGRLAVLDLEPLPTLSNLSLSNLSISNPSLFKTLRLVSLISLILVMKHQRWVVR